MTRVKALLFVHLRLVLPVVLQEERADFITANDRQDPEVAW